MKLKYLSFIVLVILCTTSCSEDDFQPGSNSKNYLPIAEQNKWVYDFEAEVGNEMSTGTDSTAMVEEVMLDNEQYQKWDSVNQVLGFGEFVYVTKIEDETFFRIPDISFGFGENISIDPILMIDDDSNQGTVLQNIDVERTFDAIPIPETNGIGGSITPTISISTSSTHSASSDQLTINGQMYNDVYENMLSLRIQVDLSASISFNDTAPVTINHTWIPDQEYANLHTWFVNQTGLVRSERTSGINEVDNTVDVPLIGEIDLASFGISVEEFIESDDTQIISEMTSYELN